MGPPMVPRTTVPGRPRAQRRGIRYGPRVRAHSRSRKVTVARPPVVVDPLTASWEGTVAGATPTIRAPS